MANMVWQGWPAKSSKGGYNFIPQMPTKFVERAFLVGGFVGSKSQAGSWPYRAQISLNDIILEQLLQLGLNLYTDIIARTNCDSHKNMMSAKVPVENFNWRTHNSMNTSKKMNNSTTNYYKHCPGPTNCDYINHKTSDTHLPITKHSQEELVYEDKDEGGNSIYVYQEVQKSTCEVTKTSMFHIRSRTISDCSIESDDSFIIFESNEDNGLDDDVIANEEDDDDDEEDEDDLEDEEEEGKSSVTLEQFEYDSSSDDELNECDEADCLGRQDSHSQIDTPRIIEANKKWNNHYGLVKTSSKSSKKVSFASGNQLIQIRKMVTWDYALRAARKGPWEMLALDRSRFKSKIQQLSDIICPVLEQNHRKRIFQQRFLQSPSLSTT